jgi:hypothetical protein
MENLEKFNEIFTKFFFKVVGLFNRIVNFFSKNTKLIYVIIITIILFEVGSYLISIEKKGVYKITTPSGTVYNTNKIDVKNGCVYFKKMITQEETIICGGCIIVKN